MRTNQQLRSSRWSPLYAARIEDLGSGDFVRAECAACGHDEVIPPSALLQGLRLAASTRILDLEPRLRCRECDARGKAVVSIRWGSGVRPAAQASSCLAG
jgi:hypothetical protein